MKTFLRLIKLIKDNVIYYSIGLIVILILISVVLQTYNRNIIIENNRVATIVEGLKLYTREVLNSLQSADLGIRGYALTKKKQLLDPFVSAKTGYKSNLDTIRQSMKHLEMRNIGDLDKVEKAFADYFVFLNIMLQAIEKDDMDTFRKLLDEDRGFTVWQIYDKSARDIYAQCSSLTHNINQQYLRAVNSIAIIEIILFVLGIPTLLNIFFKLRKDEKNRRNIIQKLEEYNRRYVFDPGTALNYKNSVHVLEDSMNNIKRASDLIKQISIGNYNANWQGLNEENKELNTENLAGSLQNLREQMKINKEENEKRVWANEGLNIFTDILKKDYANPKVLYQDILSNLIKFLKLQQGALFIVSQTKKEENILIPLM